MRNGGGREREREKRAIRIWCSGNGFDSDGTICQQGQLFSEIFEGEEKKFYGFFSEFRNLIQMVQYAR